MPDAALLEKVSNLEQSLQNVHQTLAETNDDIEMPPINCMKR